MALSSSFTLSNLRFRIAAGAIFFLGLLLRIAGARGDLWQDEITSLTLAGAAHSFVGVFLLAYDNNHFLNTAYLHLVGPDASPLVMRSFSIALGALTVPVAGLIFLPKHRGTALLAMGLFALSFPMVNYGSEARGYAGLILCTLIAIYAIDRERKYTLAFAIGFGLLFHLSMASAIAALGLATLFHYWRQTKSLVETVKKTANLFLPSLCAILPVALIIANAIQHSNGYHFGYIESFQSDHFVIGFGGMMNAMSGFSEQTSLLLGFVIALSSAVISLKWKTENNIRPIIYFSFLVILPIAVVVFHVPNSGIRRYYLCSATAYLLCIVELAGQAWHKNLHIVVVVTIMAFIVVQTADILRFIQVGRGQYSDIVRLMTAKGPSTYASVKDPWPAGLQFDYYAQRQGLSLTYVREKDACSAIPDWLGIETPLMDPDQPPTATWGNGTCMYRFGNAQIFEGWGMSAGRLTLYRRVE